MRIAAFDSGIGGLSAIAPLLREQRGVSITYLGDLANLPYGTKSPGRVKDLATSNVRFLLDHCRSSSPVDLLVLACNTASAYALEACSDVAANFGLPVVGVIQASCRAALRQEPKRVIVLATKGTVNSHAYRDELLQLGFKGLSLEIPCPLFVPLVEEGITDGPAAEWIARSYLDPMLRPDDTVILGCTHYPYLLPVLQSLYPQVTWIQAGDALLSEAPEMHRPSAHRQDTNSLEILFTDEADKPERVTNFLRSLGLGDLDVTIRKIPPVL
jgi:glutamate racemase